VGALIMIHLTQASEEALFVLSSPPFHSPKYVKSCAPVIVRASREDDVDAMLDIYRRHIARGVEPAFAHDPEALQPEDIKRRRRNMRKHRLPHLVADRAGLVMGYTYAVPFRKRPAYRYTIKHSIYVHPDYLHAGIGRILLPALIDACAAAGYRQMIGYIDASNTPSIGLHTACGFRQVGCLPLVACKFGQWTDMVMVQRSLGSGGTTTPDVWPAMPADDDRPLTSNEPWGWRCQFGGCWQAPASAPYIGSAQRRPAV
jgi:L-amino acid N-acyltransferase YncA